MGSGKTLLSLVVALKQSENKPILVVCSKSLITNWECEIDKFFDNSLNYVVLHHKNLDNFVLNNIKLILTTPEVLSKCYKLHNIKSKFVIEEKREVDDYMFLKNTLNVYNKVEKPFLNNKTGTSFLYSTTFGCYIIDEAQKFTKISSRRCQALCSVYSKNRWLLSGTMFDEPVTERILGYYIMLNHPTFPRTLPDTELYIKSVDFKGLKNTLVHREKNIQFIPPKVNKIVVSHNLYREEGQIYMTLKNTLHILKDTIRVLKINQDKDGVRKFTSYMLAMVTYLRQGIVIPLLPVSNIMLDIYDYKNNSELSIILNDQFKNLQLYNWLNNQNSAKSSRITEVLKTINNHKDEKLVLFTCFRTSVDMLKYYITDRKVLVIDSNMSIQTRGDVISEFQDDITPENKSTVLLLTYDIGAEGLNLQCAHTVLIVDFWWNIGKTNQAIARILRYGQKSNVVNIYFYTSNTGVEKALFTKQQDKQIIMDELLIGYKKSKIQKLNMDEILSLIEKNENKDMIYSINNISDKEEENKKEEVKRSCNICFEDINKEDLKILPCAIHLFHKKCINQWAKIKQSCPVCKIQY